MPILALAILLLTACNYDRLKNPPQVIPLEPTFKSIKANIFEVKCDRCHRPGGRAENILFSSPEEMLKSFDPIILMPGDPENSALVIALRPGAKKPMPPRNSNIAPVTEEQLNVIIEWIKNGAVE